MAKTAHEPQKATKEALTEAKAAWVKGKKVDGVAKSEELIPVATVLALGTYQLPPADPHQLHAMGDADAGGAAIRRRVGGGELRGRPLRPALSTKACRRTCRRRSPARLRQRWHGTPSKL